METTEKVSLIITILTAMGGVAAFWKGIIEYRKSNRIKRAEFLDKLILEFNLPANSIAINLLDDYVYVKKEDRDQSPEQQAEIATSLATYLRNHKTEPIKTDDEIAVRDSFDNLLDFFTKLSYYLSNGLVTKSELIYFRYYILKVRQKTEVLSYIDHYFFRKDFDKLFTALKTI